MTQKEPHFPLRATLLPPDHKNAAGLELEGSRTQKWVFCDASWFGHRAKHAGKGLSFGGNDTGVLYLFLNELLTVASDPRIKSNQLALFFDSKTSHRKTAFPPYKAKRMQDKTEEEWQEILAMKAQLDRLRREILPDCGFRTFKQAGLESDDLIAQAAIQLQGQEGVIITSDGDLYQCINHAVDWFDPMRNLYLDRGGLMTKKRVSPDDWVEVKCMAGCDGDGVPGIPGVGEKTATDYLWKILNPKHKRYRAIISAEGQKIIERNKALIKLPHPLTKAIHLCPPVYQPQAFWKWCKDLGMESMLTGDRRRKWEKFFAGDFADSDNRQVARKRGEIRKDV